jgi:hypothetical protein
MFGDLFPFDQTNLPLRGQAGGPAEAAKVARISHDSFFLNHLDGLHRQ